MGFQHGGSDTESYGFGAADGGDGETPNMLGTPPGGDSTEAIDLTGSDSDSTYAGDQWVAENSPWDFGTVPSETPALKYITGATLSVSGTGMTG